ncbi:CotH kinase family protein [Spirosoma pollinicola]|nr:CotH kinase family protein [Spirosoma pollinicola]
MMSFTCTAQQLYINEIMASNSQTIADGAGAYEDWFEIYNPNPTPVNIAGYYLSDNSNLIKYHLPVGSSQTIIPANGYLLLWASDVVSRGPLHVGFKLSADGEMISLVQPDGSTVVDQVLFGAQRTDVSWGRQPNGSSTWLYFQRTNSINNTSPGASNNAKTGYATIMSDPIFSQVGGFYSTDFSLTITSSDPTATIFYTLDGSDPDPVNPGPNTFQYKNNYAEQPGQGNGSFLTESYQTRTYSSPLSISDRTSSPNKVSTKSSTFNSSPYYIPTEPVFKGTVVRAVVYKANALMSDVVSETYFIAPATRYGNLPVVSISTNEKSLFDYNSGIYTAGTTFDGWRAGNPTAESIFCSPGNFTNKDDNWQRSAHVQFFINGRSVLNQHADIAINGGCSRSTPRKSLRLYGDTDFNYPFFSNRPINQYYNRLLLRSGGNDWNFTTLIDTYMQTMVRHLPFDTQSNRPGIVFLNGEYWGVHNLMERYDQYYLNRNYGVDPDSVDIIKFDYGAYQADNGDLVKFYALKDYFVGSPTIDYGYVSTLMDVDGFSDYQISEIYAGNFDWPYNNQQLWRKRTSQYVPTAPKGHDGRFRWMMNDMDWTLGAGNDYTSNSLDRATSTGYDVSVTEYTRFLRRLLEVSSYKTYFINRFADLLNTTFIPGRNIDLLNTFQQSYQPYMDEHFSRWKTGNSLTKWLSNVNIVRTFLQQRPAYVRDHIRSRFSLTANRTITLSVSDTAKGYVKINTIDILPSTVGVATNPYPWTGTYFQGNAVRVVAKARVGYRFVSWQENSATISTDTAYSFDPTTNRSLIAQFDLDNSSTGKPTAYNLSTCEYRFDAFPATTPAGTYPPNMYFVSMNAADPALSATFALADTVKGAYNLTSATRINGLGSDGIAMINTGSAPSGYIAGALGGVVLGLRTTNLTEATVQWTGGTVTPNPRQYNIRLRYRIGNSGPFTDLTDGANNPVEYVRNATAGHSQDIGPVSLPTALLNKPYIQLLWQYYYTGVGTSGARDQLRIDNISIRRGGCQSISSGSWHTASTWNCGRVPSVCDDVVIRAGHVVSVTTNAATARSIRFELAGQLQYVNANASVYLQNP